VNAIEAEPRFVNGAGAKRMCFTQGDDLPLPAASISVPGNRLSALRRRLDPVVSLIGIVAVYVVVAPKPVIDVERVLIVCDRSDTGPAKCTRPAVGHGNQREKFLDNRVCYRNPLSVRQDAAVKCQRLTVLESFITEEEKRSILDDRAAKGST